MWYGGIPTEIADSDVGQYYNRVFDNVLKALGNVSPPYPWLSGDKSIIPDKDIEDVRKLTNSVILVTK